MNVLNSPFKVYENQQMQCCIPSYQSCISYSPCNRMEVVHPAAQIFHKTYGAALIQQHQMARWCVFQHEGFP